MLLKETRKDFNAFREEFVEASSTIHALAGLAAVACVLSCLAVGIAVFALLKDGGETVGGATERVPEGSAGDE